MNRSKDEIMLDLKLVGHCRQRHQIGLMFGRVKWCLLTEGELSHRLVNEPSRKRLLLYKEVHSLEMTCHRFEK